MTNAPPFSGRVGWIDLTTPQTETIRDFYAGVLNLQPAPVSMGSYEDYNLLSPETGLPVVGVCHPQGPNAALPALWLVYFTVPDLDAALAEALARGGTLVDGPRAGFAVLRDPGGAVFALFHTPEDSPGPDQP